jgi:hypothetical protein
MKIEGMQEEHRRVDRRRRRLVTGVCAGLFAVLNGCGGAAGDDPAANASWDVAPARSLSLARGTSFNLAETLPADVTRGGVFDVDPSGSPLPAGVVLLPSGLLSVGATASGSAVGVVFRYTPPLPPA